MILVISALSTGWRINSYIYLKKEMNELIVKYNRLNKTARKEVNDWLDFY